MALYNDICRHCGKPIERKTPKATWLHSATGDFRCDPNKGTSAEPTTNE